MLRFGAEFDTRAAQELDEAKYPFPLQPIAANTPQQVAKVLYRAARPQHFPVLKGHDVSSLLLSTALAAKQDS